MTWGNWTRESLCRVRLALGVWEFYHARGKEAPAAKAMLLAMRERRRFQ